MKNIVLLLIHLVCALSTQEVNAQYIHLAKVSDKADHPLPDLYIAYDYSCVQFIVDTTILRNRFRKKFCIVSEPSFNELIEYSATQKYDQTVKDEHDYYCLTFLDATKRKLYYAFTATEYESIIKSLVHFISSDSLMVETDKDNLKKVISNTFGVR